MLADHSLNCVCIVEADHNVVSYNAPRVVTRSHDVHYMFLLVVIFNFDGERFGRVCNASDYSARWIARGCSFGLWSGPRNRVHRQPLGLDESQAAPSLVERQILGAAGLWNAQLRSFTRSLWRR